MKPLSDRHGSYLVKKLSDRHNSRCSLVAYLSPVVCLKPPRRYPETDRPASEASGWPEGSPPGIAAAPASSAHQQASWGTTGVLHGLNQRFFRSERKGSVMRTVLVSIFLFLAFIFCPVHAEGKDLPTLVSLSGAG